MPYEEDYKMWLEKALIRMNPDWVCDEMSNNEFTHNWCHQYCGEDDAYITPKCLHMYYHHIARVDRKDEPSNSEKPNNCEDKPQYDFGAYADRLWKIAYERGKREALEQTEPSCDTCKLKDTTEWCKRQEVCRAYQPTISKMEQVDEPQIVKKYDTFCGVPMAEAIEVMQKYKASKDEPQLTPNYCGTCKHREVPCGDLPCDVCHGYSNYEPKDEPQAPYDNCKLCKFWFGYCHLEECGFTPIKDEPQTDCAWR